jgi:hypothetical protein
MASTSGSCGIRWTAAADLHVSGMLGAIVAHQERHAGDAFITDHTHFDPVILGIHRHDRGDADFQKIGMGDRLGGEPR